MGLFVNTIAYSCEIHHVVCRKAKGFRVVANILMPEEVGFKGDAHTMFGRYPVAKGYVCVHPEAAPVNVGRCLTRQRVVKPYACFQKEAVGKTFLLVTLRNLRLLQHIFQRIDANSSVARLRRRSLILRLFCLLRHSFRNEQ